MFAHCPASIAQPLFSTVTDDALETVVIDADTIFAGRIIEIKSAATDRIPLVATIIVQTDNSIVGSVPEQLMLLGTVQPRKPASWLARFRTMLAKPLPAPRNQKKLLERRTGFCVPRAVQRRVQGHGLKNVVLIAALSLNPDDHTQ